MRIPLAEELHQVHGRPAKGKGLLEYFGVMVSQVEHASVGFDEIRQSQKEVAQRMAADPLTQDHDLSEAPGSGIALQSQRVFNSPRPRHLVGRGAQPADARDHVWQPLHPASTDKFLKPPELEHLESDRFQPVLIEYDVNVRIAFESGRFFKDELGCHRILDASFMKFSLNPSTLAVLERRV